MMSSVPAKMKKIRSKIEALECSQHYTSFFRRARADNSVVVVISGRNLNSSNLSCMSSLPARMKKIKLKMNVLDCSQEFSHYKSMGSLPNAQGQPTLLSTVRTGQISNSSKTLWLYSLPAKMKIRSKIEALECSQHYTSFFSDVQGQITLLLGVVSGRNLNSSKLSCMHSLPARMRLITSKMKELECSQDFSYYKSMGIFPDPQGQLTPQSLVRSGRISNSSEMLWMSLLPASMNKIRSKIEALECSQHYTSIFLAEFRTRPRCYGCSCYLQV